MIEIIDEFKKDDYNLENFVKEVQEDEKLRDRIVKELLGSSDIKIILDCYEILNKASLENPKLFYKYWKNFYSLIKSRDYNHRNIGSTLIANLISVDENNLFEEIAEEYFSHINDEYFKTSQVFIKNITRISKVNDKYIERLTDIYLNIDNIWTYNEKQKEQLKFDLIRFFETFYGKIDKKEQVVKYVQDLANSVSPKTRRRSKNSKLKKYYK
ncbi:hypothetical protein [Miniphocaeibacter halophilus]|uniref:Uncharacterized protein n=1 Tax=Miniphocaeibacter halophilus TaxID=2931922 RepID=A0AC61MSL7_9FIRM|nr:hypothetical protein [Miniphocaeibacter halophilus]QQK07441.1 hypothetical protein JFY71_08990 [Miniphocaeibacter halophilus]